MKILYIHNKTMWYNLPFFNKLSEMYEMKFLFTDEKEVTGLKADYELLKNYGIYPFNITPGLGPRLISEDFDVVVWPSIAGPFLDHIICFFIVRIIKRKPYIWGSDRWFHNRGLLSVRGFRNTLSNLLFRFIARNASAYFVPGKKHKEYSITIGVPSDKIYIVPNASTVDFENKDFEEAKKLKTELGLEHKKIILYVGRLKKYKGVEYLIKAFAKLKEERKDIVLVIVGDDYFSEKKNYFADKLKSFCEDLNVSESVCFIGEMKHDKLAPFYILSNIFVLPSVTLGYNEAWGLVINEAMSFAKPIVTTDAVGAAYALIKDGVNGFMVPEKDADALYKAIKEIVENPEVERKMGSESKKIIEEGFTYEHTIDGFKRVIEYVLKE